MITANTLKKCAWLDQLDIERLLRKSYPNYPKGRVQTSEFLGITNGGQFCYKIGYHDVEVRDQELAHCKVFVWQNNNGDLVANY